MLPELFVREMLARRGELVQIGRVLFGDAADSMMRNPVVAGAHEGTLLEALALATTPKRYATAAYRDSSLSLEVLEKMGDAACRLCFSWATAGAGWDAVRVAKAEDTFLSNASMAQRARRVFPSLDAAILWPRGVSPTSREAEAIRADVFEALLGVLEVAGSSRAEVNRVWGVLHREELEVLLSGGYVPDGEVFGALAKWLRIRAFPESESRIVEETSGHEATTRVEIRVGSLVSEGLAPRKAAAFADGYRKMLAQLDRAERSNDFATLTLALVPAVAERAEDALVRFARKHELAGVTTAAVRGEPGQKGDRHRAVAVVGRAEWTAAGGNARFAGYKACARALEELLAAVTAEAQGVASQAQKTILRKARSPLAAAEAAVESLGASKQAVK